MCKRNSLHQKKKKKKKKKQERNKEKNNNKKAGKKERKKEKKKKKKKKKKPAFASKTALEKKRNSPQKNQVSMGCVREIPHRKIKTARDV